MISHSKIINTYIKFYVLGLSISKFKACNLPTIYSTCQLFTQPANLFPNLQTFFANLPAFSQTYQLFSQTCQLLAQPANFLLNLPTFFANLPTFSSTYQLFPKPANFFPKPANFVPNLPTFISKQGGPPPPWLPFIATLFKYDSHFHNNVGFINCIISFFLLSVYFLGTLSVFIFH